MQRLLSRRTRSQPHTPELGSALRSRRSSSAWFTLVSVLHLTTPQLERELLLGPLDVRLSLRRYATSAQEGKHLSQR